MSTPQVTVSYVSAPNEEVARSLARKLIKNRLAACVNIIKDVESVYEWNDKVEQDKEILLVIKSRDDKAKMLADFIEANHPYECPECISVKVVGGSSKYMNWIGQVLQKPLIPETAPDTTSTSISTK